MNEPIFRKESLPLYSIIEEPGTYIVKVANTVLPKYLIEDNSKSRYIVNLRVGTIEGLEETLNILGNKQECAFHNIKHCFISGTLWENTIDDILVLPTKGENVIATFDYVDDIMRCISLTLIPRKTLKNFNPNAYNLSRALFKDLNL